MLLPRLQSPLRAALTSIARSSAGGQSTCLIEGFAQLSIRNPGLANGLKLGNGLVFRRNASHKSQGAVNKAKDGPGKRLGAKKSGEQYVIPGNIIFRQRGTHWFPGDNCAMGRDHTIYATEHGYVKYYKDPEKHPKRQYIGVVFERNQVLPLPRNSMRRRKLNMVAHKIEAPVVPQEATTLVRTDLITGEDGKVKAAVKVKKLKERRGEEGRNLQLKNGGMYREANWEIGRAAERAGVKVKKFKPRDRWTAWKKAIERNAKIMEKKSLGRKTKK